VLNKESIASKAWVAVFSWAVSLKGYGRALGLMIL
jgi:hypothetical protein